MKTINKNCENEIIIKNSRFITFLIKIKTVEQVALELKTIKNSYPKATHYCYAYKLGLNIAKADDDKEPSGTAGVPMLNVLNKEDISNVLAVTVRYFGGVKLGAGGLIRAYSRTIREALAKVSLVELVKGYYVEIECSYEEVNSLDRLLKQEKIVSKDYLYKIIYRVLIAKDDISLLQNYAYKILEDVLIERN